MAKFDAGRCCVGKVVRFEQVLKQPRREICDILWMSFGSNKKGRKNGTKLQGNFGEILVDEFFFCVWKKQLQKKQKIGHEVDFVTCEVMKALD